MYGCMGCPGPEGLHKCVAVITPNKITVKELCDNPTKDSPDVSKSWNPLAKHRDVYCDPIEAQNFKKCFAELAQAVMGYTRVVDSCFVTDCMPGYITISYKEKRKPKVSGLFRKYDALMEKEVKAANERYEKAMDAAARLIGELEENI